MLHDNIRKYRKENNMSQDELAEKLGVSRQSISLWETGQSQPTIENIIALTKVFGVSSDALLGTAESAPAINDTPEEKPAKKKRSDIWVIPAIIITAAAIICGVIWFTFAGKDDSTADGSEDSSASAAESTPSADSGDVSQTVSEKAPATSRESEASETSQVKEKIDIYEYCKNYAIKNGTLNGDYSTYQQPATRYGGYENEYFSITYWSGYDKVEFCLHCPLDDTYSINFYLCMRGGYNGKYEYSSSRYYRSDGVSVRSVSGYIDPAVFSDNYPLSFDSYKGTVDKQTDFLEESRVSMCDLIHCLKEFVDVENLDCDFSDFEFVNY